MDEDVWDAWYVHHRLPSRFIPMGAVVTASGTGAEQNNGAGITHEQKKLKQPLFGAFHSFAVLDSDLTKTLPMHQVVSGAFDTLSQYMETYMEASCLQPLRRNQRGHDAKRRQESPRPDCESRRRLCAW